jgi:Sel1 repeat
MSQRITIDRASFEQVLCATSLIQRLNMQVGSGRIPNHDAPQPLSDLVEAQLAIETETIDLETVMNRVVDLAVKLSRATGAATWLFSGHEFVYRAGTGSGANDERLQFDALSELASICGPSDHSIHDPRESNHWSPAYEAIHWPGSVKSLLVVPVYCGRSVAGALAAFSVEFNAFTELDATNARLLSGLLTHALSKAAEAELKQTVSLERATMLQAIDQLIPALRKLAEKEPETCGNGVLESADSPSALRVVTDKTESSDRLMLQTEQEQTSDVPDYSSPPAYLAPEPTWAPESTSAPLPPNITTFTSGTGAAAARIHRDSSFWAVTGLTELAHRQMSKVRLWLSTTMDTSGGLLGIATYRFRPSAPARHRLKLPVLSTAAVLAVFLIMFVSLFSITRASHPSNTAVAPSDPSTAAKLVPTTEPSQGLHQRSDPVLAHQLSHMRVTDAAMSSALPNLSRYEIVGLRRRAAYGDDSAALLLGMAYETGHLVPQSCIQAAAWVTESANEGNAAAQYNLGLRYRYGDGVPVNQEVGAGWLRKAAAQKYSQAQLALDSVP